MWYYCNCYHNGCWWSGRYLRPGSRFNIKMLSCQYRESHRGDKTVAVRQQTITWTNVDLSSMRSLGIHLTALSLNGVKIPINKTRLKIAVLKWHLGLKYTFIVLAFATVVGNESNELIAYNLILPSYYLHHHWLIIRHSSGCNFRRKAQGIND